MHNQAVNCLPSKEYSCHEKTPRRHSLDLPASQRICTNPLQMWQQLPTNTVRRQRQRRHRSNSRLGQSRRGKACRIRCSRKSACSKFANSKQKTSPASSKQKIGRQQKCTLCRWSHLQQWHMRARVSTCSLPTENEINPSSASSKALFLHASLIRTLFGDACKTGCVALSVLLSSGNFLSASCSCAYFC